MSQPDWARLESDVVERIRALAVIFREASDMPPELKEKTWNELALPNLRLLAEFCANVTIEEAEEQQQ